MSSLPIHIETDQIDKDGWNELIMQFSDATLYQTWSYGSVSRRPGDGVSHAVFKAGNTILGCCQVIIRRPIPLGGIGIADVKWGPLCENSGRPAEAAVLHQLIQHLKQEYAIKRNLLLRIWPHATAAQREAVTCILKSEGFERNSAAGVYRTLRLDLSPSLGELRQNLLQKWRNHLNKAEKTGLSIIEGTKNELYTTFLVLAGEMRERKRFAPGVDYDTYGRIQDDLPEALKMKIVVCEADGMPICVSVYSVIGQTGIYLLGASANKGMGLNGSYLVQWHIIKQLKANGVRYYDLGGVDPVGNPGVYQFKVGIAGKKCCEETLLGEFWGDFTLKAKMTKCILRGWRFLCQKRNGAAETDTTH